MTKETAASRTEEQTSGPLVNGRPAMTITRSGPATASQSSQESEGSREFRLWSCTVSRAFRERLLDLYPALRNHENARAYLRIVLYILFNAMRDPENREIIFPYTLVQELVEDRRRAIGHSAQDWIERFSRDVFRLNVTEYRYTEGRARTVSPDVHPEILQMLRDGRARAKKGAKKGDRVDFVSGEDVSYRAQCRAEKEREKHYRDLALAHASDPTHPAHELLDYLSGQNYLERILKRNWPQVRQAAENLPERTKRERARKKACSLTLGRLDQFRQSHYIQVHKTPRIFAAGTNIHQLPREIRKIALKGGTELDLKACQLAVVAKVWNIRELQEFLASGESIWDKLADDTLLPTTYKPILKTTIYSILFGMEWWSLFKQLAYGTKADDGIGRERAILFLESRLISALLAARERELNAIQTNRGGTDTFGHWWPMAEPGSNSSDASDDADTAFVNENGRDSRARSVLAAIIQSYELKLMLAMLPVLKANQQIYMLSWLHDGVTLYFGNSSKKERQIRQLQAAIEAVRLQMGIETKLVVTPL